MKIELELSEQELQEFKEILVDEVYNSEQDLPVLAKVLVQINDLS